MDSNFDKRIKTKETKKVFTKWIRNSLSKVEEKASSLRMKRETTFAKKFAWQRIDNGEVNHSLTDYGDDIERIEDVKSD